MAKLGVNPIVVTAATEIMNELCRKLDENQKDLLTELNELENNKVNARNSIFGKSFLKELFKRGEKK